MWKVFCFFARGHAWRKARKSEDQSLKYCARCGETAVVNKRKKEQS